MLGFLVAAAVSVAGATPEVLHRPADPVVLLGADIPTLQRTNPMDLVAFRFANRWEQIPVQIDERDMVDFTRVYNDNWLLGGLVRLDYTDAGTYAGPDSDPTLDADDEIVFMAKDAGVRCPAAVGAPPGVLEDQGIEVAVTDPLDGATAYVYLFIQDGSLDPAAGARYVDYTFHLLAGDYLTHYQLVAGPNPEDSAVVTDTYKHHFSDRWKSDEIRIFASGASGVDILDRHKNLFKPNKCGRSEDTFSDGEGAFIVNKNGPVRALRCYIGANSGARTERLHLFYAEREDITTFLRVHSIPSVMDFFDYSPEAAGMTYYNNNALAGVTIDGIPDVLPEGRVDWELVTGAQGSLAMLHTLSTDMPGFAPTNYYLDSTTPPVVQCTGDAFAYGSSGHYINQEIPNTDPFIGAHALFSVARTIYYLPPGVAPSDVQTLRQRADHPLTLAYSAFDFGPKPQVPASGTYAMILLGVILGGFGAGRSAIAAAQMK